VAGLTLRIRESLKRKARGPAMRHGVSLDGFVNATLAATVAQEEALAYLDDHLKGQDLEALPRRVVGFMQSKQPGPKPAPDRAPTALSRRSR